jgi:hypothetical protein
MTAVKLRGRRRGQAVVGTVTVTVSRRMKRMRGLTGLQAAGRVSSIGAQLAEAWVNGGTWRRDTSARSRWA